MNDKGLNRFWSKVDKRGPDECWLWTGSMYPDGYGQFKDPQRVSPKRAHRVAMELAGVAMPSGALALHSCDNRRCVNVAHLRAGSHAENMSDRQTRNPTNRPGAVLTVEQAQVIRFLCRSTTLLQREIGALFGVTNKVVNLIAKRKTWALVPEIVIGALGQ